MRYILVCRIVLEIYQVGLPFLQGMILLMISIGVDQELTRQALYPGEPVVVSQHQDAVLMRGLEYFVGPSACTFTGIPFFALISSRQEPPPRPSSVSWLFNADSEISVELLEFVSDVVHGRQVVGFLLSLDLRGMLSVRSSLTRAVLDGLNPMSTAKAA